MIRIIYKRLQHLRPIAPTVNHVSLFSSSPPESNLNSSSSSGKQSLSLSYVKKSRGLSSESVKLASENLPSVLNLLKTNGLTQTYITSLVTNQPVILLANPEKTLKPTVDLLASLGISGTKLVKVLDLVPRVLLADIQKVVELFRAHGISEEQISVIIMKCPGLLTFNPGKYLKPKLEYFNSIGLSVEEISKLVSLVPSILTRSLERQIIPSVEIIRRVVGSDENVIKAIKSSYRILGYNLEKVLEGNIAVLMNHGVPKSVVSRLFQIHMNTLLLSNHKFAKVVKKVSDLGFNPKNVLFVTATRTLACLSESYWKQKIGVYSSFGFSEDEIISVFRAQPLCMMISAKKIGKGVDFLLNKLKLQPSAILKDPNVLLLSLEKRIFPRCSVLQVLISKRLIKEDINLVRALRMNEKKFVERFVTKYQHEVPEVLEAAHLGKIEFQGLVRGTET